MGQADNVEAWPGRCDESLSFCTAGAAVHAQHHLALAHKEHFIYTIIVKSNIKILIFIIDMTSINKMSKVTFYVL